MKPKKATEALIVKTGRGYRPMLATSGGGFRVSDGGNVVESRESRTINLGGDGPVLGQKQTRVTERVYDAGAVIANIGRVELRFGVHGDSYIQEKHRKMIKRARRNDITAIRAALRKIERARTSYREAVAQAWKRGRYIETKEEASESIEAAGFDLKEWSVAEHPDSHPLVFSGNKQARKL